eukprot:8792816-Heterocapsa_arctica.AAC.1
MAAMAFYAWFSYVSEQSASNHGCCGVLCMVFISFRTIREQPWLLWLFMHGFHMFQNNPRTTMAAMAFYA